MENNSIVKKLNELYADGKSKNFINHLVKAYFPVSKAVKVMEKPQARMYCVVTNKKLLAVNEVLSGAKADDFNVSISDAMEGKGVSTAFTRLMSGRVLAITGEDTTTFISFEGLKALQEWVAAKVKEQDKHISWLVKNINKASQPIKPVRKQSYAEANGYRKPATTFGELDALQKLKVQLEAEER